LDTCVVGDPNVAFGVFVADASAQLHPKSIHLPFLNSRMLPDLMKYHIVEMRGVHDRERLY
jgi:hypothetical protein